ncbi:MULTISPECIES: hypothetical protein [unclassified Cryobacterium]|uniref:hypothetical protein n=1 Tax=unclassified Cryobacterium TaxID=2649013 RepID=UPI00106A4724|nr:MULTISPECIES: hypothetical protein [unclassified Cryobacterium]TFB96554.1 hypothetical protein E3O39_10810 [Cryobacterium sp. MDB2-A-1]TFC12838.1 hypothetical protein E3O35_07970 [Cryobacterium sp. MDB2-A-2]
MNGVPIKREDIKAGDRFTVTHWYTASVDLTTNVDTDATYELIERPVVLPVVPGVYEDSKSNLWRLHFGSEDVPQEWTLNDAFVTDQVARQYAPFKPLRPVAEVAAEVLADVRKNLSARVAFMADIDAIETKWVKS